ncbi:MAG TPA: undecaprenyl-diphosphate phosphatase [Solirubrobacteraceae bacterium]|nr:undecaprenyl-diphosphate phosphatase [Solirubrobacteraceae bacterium]
MPRTERALSLRHAVALGLAQGPTELLPISSSAHTILIPFLAGWPYAELDPELRKSFEVALHAGAALALALDMRGELVEEILHLDRRHALVVALSLAPPAVVGYALERFIERRLGGPRSIAVGLLAGAIAMAIADSRPGRWEGPSPGSRGRNPRPGGRPARGTRHRADACSRDGLALGLAQAAALIPGVSRNGATLTVARMRGFARRDAQALSWHAALPVILGASALKGHGLARGGVPQGAVRALMAGGGTAFLSTLTSARLLRQTRQQDHSLLPYALYRCLLAALVVRRLRDAHNTEG